MRDLPAGFTLSKGSHSSFDRGACIMEAVAYVAGEPHSDEPVCTSRVLTRIAIRLNDRFTDEERQQLALLIPRLVGTRTDRIELERARAFVMVDASIREIVPIALEIRWPDLAKQLRDIGPIVDTTTARTASKVTKVVRDEARKRAAADADAAAAAAAYAAYAAAADAAYAVYAAADADADAAADAAYAAADAAADARRRIVLASVAAFERCIEVQL